MYGVCLPACLPLCPSITVAISSLLCPPHPAEYADPDVVQVSPASQTAPSTFKPAPEEGYTLPLVVNHYDVPSKYHEYAEPLPPEPEYATPFIDQQPTEPEGPACQRNLQAVKAVSSSLSRASAFMPPGCSEQYHFPAQRPAEMLDSQASETGLGGEPIRSGPGHGEPPGHQPLSPRDGLPTTQLATSPQGHSFQLRHPPLARVYHEPL